MYNLLTEKLIRTAPNGRLTLPGLLAALARDEVDSFPALRPHQGPSWHMFLVQLAALALRGSGRAGIVADEAAWLAALRELTPGFAADEPWQLVGADWTRPALLQPPVPEGVALENRVPTPDALDLLITAKNHDLKQAIARQAEPEDWLFALVSLQTTEGYGGTENQGIARMNGGHSSRFMLSLAPLPAVMGKTMTPRLGTWFRRDVTVLLETCESEFKKYDFYAEDGIGLTWISPWAEGDQLQLKNLDIWFIEVCRRIRLTVACGVLSGCKTTSNATRIDAKHMNGALGDPFAPVHKTDRKGLTLGIEGALDYKRIVDLLLSGNWIIPLLALPASCDGEEETMALVAEALARGNNKTGGFKSRILPIAGNVSRALGKNRAQLHELAKAQTETVAGFAAAIGAGLALAAANGVSKEKKEGDQKKPKKGAKQKEEKDNHKEHRYAREAKTRFDRAVDGIFFDYLWDRLEAQDKGREALAAERLRWAKKLLDFATSSFEAALPGIPCAGIFRPRAEARARRAFYGTIRHHHPELFDHPVREEANHAA